MLSKSYKYFFYILTINVFFFTVNSMPPHRQQQQNPNRLLPPIGNARWLDEGTTVDPLEETTMIKPMKIDQHKKSRSDKKAALEQLNDYIPALIKCDGIRFHHNNTEIILDNENPNSIKKISTYKFVWKEELTIKIELCFFIQLESNRIVSLSIVPTLYTIRNQNEDSIRLPQILKIKNRKSIIPSIETIFIQAYPKVLELITNL